MSILSCNDILLRVNLLNNSDHFALHYLLLAILHCFFKRLVKFKLQLRISIFFSWNVLWRFQPCRAKVREERRFWNNLKVDLSLSNKFIISRISNVELSDSIFFPVDSGCSQIIDLFGEWSFDLMNFSQAELQFFFSFHSNRVKRNLSCWFYGVILCSLWVKRTRQISVRNVRHRSPFSHVAGHWSWWIDVNLEHSFVLADSLLLE